MIKSLVAAVALTIGLADYAVAQEGAPRHRQHHHHHIRPGLSPHVQGPSPYLQPGPSAYVPRAAAFEAPDIYWSPAGGNPVHYAQTTGFYGGR
jgi:hypothetical protein